MSGYDSIFRPDLLRDRVVLVTGGGTGIGRCIAHELAALGATVILSGRRVQLLEETAAEIAAVGGRADTLAFDVRDAEAVEAAVATAVERHGAIWGLVNNAGGQFPAPAETISPNGWRAVIDVNLNGTFLVSRAVYKLALYDGGGAIVNIVADMWNGFPGMAHTGAARAGVVNLTKTLAREWAGRGVRVNAVAPGLIYSSGMDTYPPEVHTLVAAKGTRVPAGRVGTESEVAAAVTFLLSPPAAFITGETLRVDGGSSLQSEPLLPPSPGRPLPTYDGFHLARDVPPAWRADQPGA